MTQEDKELLLKDLCARLPYKVKIMCNNFVDIGNYFIGTLINSCPIERRFEVLTEYGILPVYLDNDDIKPYLRPMSSMTEEEYKELKKISGYYGLAPFEDIYDWGPNYEMIDWLNSHHFDYRDLIDKGLALEAFEGMYKF